MSVKFFCKICDKEIWEGMEHSMKETTTISEAEETAICSDCMIENFKKDNDK